ncbi:hypothetical protein BBJ28_00012445 [Nothophytophthora sp. Chile5]|nr:hypothetical protein BBJ28_00012445 [Nothophytophthora sp. Chile5]
MSRSVLPPLQESRAKSPSLGLLPALVADTTSASQRSRLQQPRQRVLPPHASSSTAVKFPALVKPQQQLSAAPRCNQDEEERDGSRTALDNNADEDEEDKRHRLSSSRTSASSSSSLTHTRAAGDKNRAYIKGLEEKKRKEKEDRVRQEKRKKKLHEKLTRKILQEAEGARQKQAMTSSPEADDVANELLGPKAGGPDERSEPQEDESDKEGEAAAAQKRKDKARRQKRLLKKQQAHLEQIRAKQREKLEELEMEKERERRKQEKATKTILDAIQDANNRWEENQEAASEDDGGDEHLEDADAERGPMLLNSVPSDQQESPGPADEQAHEQSQRAKEQRETIHRKQQEYLQKLADQRKQKQKEEEDALILQAKRKKKIQKEAKLRLQEAAAKQQALAEIKEKEEAAAAASEKAANAGPPVDVEAMVARLSKLKDRDAQIIPEARDFVSWKKRHGVGPEQKVFCMTGWYPMIREELEKRGWFFNQEKVSPFFDLKWSLKSDDLKAFKVEKYQYVNHFFQNTAITTKVGLLHNLRNAVWHQSVDIDALFPRAYDLNEPRDMELFVQDFRYGVAEGLLKQLARHGLQLKNKESGVTSMGANEALVDVVLDVARKKIRSKRPGSDELESPADPIDVLEESVDNPLSSGVDELVTDLQWEILTTCQLDKPGKLRASVVYKKKVYAEDKADGAFGDNSSVDTVLSAREKRQQRQAEKLLVDAFNREKARLAALMTHVSPVRDAVFDDALRLTRELERVCPQFHINGGAEFLEAKPHPAAATSTSLNVWIVKPAGMSRGRGIRVFNDLEQLLEYADVENHKECQWVAQKYIENPLLVCKRKFDIRQWVLVTGWDPLTVWFYEDCYLRFSSEEYSTEDLSDQYVHLTNNSIQKYSDKFNDVYSTEDGEMQVEGNMWHSDDFKRYLATKLERPEDWEARVHPRMKEIVVQSLQCVQDMVQHRSNCCELYGYDFMLDEELQPWLIEVNSSPACDYSTPTAKRYVETGLAGIVKVIVDHREYEQKKKSGGGVGAEEPDTGCWRRIHKAEFIGKPTSSYGADFQVQGAKLQRSRRGAKLCVKAVGKTSTSNSSDDEGVEQSELLLEGDDDDASASQGEEVDDAADAEDDAQREQEEEAEETDGDDSPPDPSMMDELDPLL